jgi:putative hydrolase of the HAD superfamily
MKTQFKAVFFDLDGTLRILDPAPTNAFIDFAERLGHDIDIETAITVKLFSHRYWADHDRVAADTKRFDEDGFWLNYSRLLLEAAGVSDDLTGQALQLRTLFETEYAPKIELVPEGRQLLHDLRQRDYVLALISNRTNPLEEAVIELALESTFDLVLAAGEIGYWKPNPTIFHHALDHFDGLRPEECIYIGDNYFADGHGASAAGILPVLYDPEEIYRDSDYHLIRSMSDLWSILEPAQPADAAPR